MKGDERHPTFLRVNLGVAAMHAFSPSAAAFGASFESRLKNLRRLAWVIDGVFRLPGTRFRFGLNGLIGLAPLFFFYVM